MRRPLARRRDRFLVLALAVCLPAFSSTAWAQETECDAGDTEVSALNFEGNRSFGDAELAQRIATTPSSLTRRILRRFGKRRCLDPDGLRKDAVRLKDFYKDRGFYDTGVDTLVEKNGNGSVDVTFRINEGPPMRTDSLAIDGLDSVRNRNDIVHELNLSKGARFGLALMAADLDTLRSRLRNSGYPYADVLPESRTNAAEHRATVTLTVIPGPYTRFGAIHVTSTPAPDRPLVQIDSPVVRRLLGIEPGDEYTDRALTVARRTLLQTGAFEHVELDVMRDTSQVKRDSTIGIAVQLREGLMRQIDTDFGWGTLDCFRGSAQYSDRNFASRAVRFEFLARASKLAYGSPTNSTFTRDNLCRRSTLDEDEIASSVVNYSINTTFRQAIGPGGPNAAVSASREVRGEYKAYLRTTLVGGEASVSRDLPRSTSVRAAYSLEYGKTDAEPALLCGVFLRCNQAEQDQVTAPLRLAVASLAFQQRTTDNVIDPRVGTVVRAEARGSSRWLWSDTSLSFLKGTLDAAYYHALAPRTVFAARLRFGAIAGGATANGTRLPPPQERLYAGGATSVRGYQQNELGDLVYLFTEAETTVVNDSTLIFNPRPGAKTDRTIPVGGNLLVVGNIDFRFRDPFFPNRIQYTLFTDIGAVWTRREGDPGLGNHLKYTPGVGVRYFSDIGPIQVNVGYNPYPRPAGKAFFAPPEQTGGFSSLFCISPGADLPVRRLPGSNIWVQDDSDGDCPSSFTPAPVSGGTFTRFFRKLTFTLSIGPDF